MVQAEETVFLLSVNPVWDIEESVEAESCDGVRGDVLYDSDFVQQYDLRDES